MGVLDQLGHRNLLCMTPKSPKPEEIKDTSPLFSEMQEGKTDWVANTVASLSA